MLQYGWTLITDVLMKLAFIDSPKSLRPSAPPPATSSVYFQIPLWSASQKSFPVTDLSGGDILILFRFFCFTPSYSSAAPSQILHFVNLPRRLLLCPSPVLSSPPLLALNTLTTVSVFPLFFFPSPSSARLRISSSSSSRSRHSAS